MTPSTRAFRRSRLVCRLLLLKLLVLPALSTASFGQQAAAKPSLEVADWQEGFSRWTLSVQVLGGVYFSPCLFGPATPTVNFASLDLRLGWMLGLPSKLWILPRGNLQGLVACSVDNIFEGHGSYLAGLTLLLRYNIVPEGWRLVPYLQIGVGVLYTDIHECPEQCAIGQWREFVEHYSLGLRWLINPRWSIEAEAGYLHVSNADQAERNAGLNAVGVCVGVTRAFGR